MTDAGVVEADAQAVDLGVLAPGQERTVPFTLRNTGDGPVALLGTESECGCTTAELRDTTIPPIGWLTVDVHFSGARTGRPLPRSVTVRTDSEPGSITFTIFRHDDRMIVDQRLLLLSNSTLPENLPRLARRAHPRFPGIPETRGLRALCCRDLRA